jgi:putative transposase
MNRSQRILLNPSTSQKRYFVEACGLSRFAWNWALSRCERHYRMYGNRPGYRRPGSYRIQKHWNKVKNRRFPWALRFSKYIAEESFKKLELAYAAAFRRMSSGKKLVLPKRRKKHIHESFQVVPSSYKPMRRDGPRFNIPRLGMVKCQTPIRWPDGKQVSGRVKCKAGRWWLTLSYDLPDPPKLPEGRPTCGIDLGSTTFSTVASGGVVVEEVPPPKPYAKAKKRLKRLSRAVSRKKKGVRNRAKAIRRLARQHERVANVRDNFLHQFTSRIVKQYGTVKVEDLNVNGMARGRLAGTIRDLGWGEFRRQVEYKSEATGTKVVVADRFYPSSKTCSTCGRVKTKLDLAEREWTCDGCGLTHNRDHNAAINLEKLPQGMGKVTPAEIGGSPPSRKTKRGAGRGSRNIN